MFMHRRKTSVKVLCKEFMLFKSGNLSHNLVSAEMGPQRVVTRLIFVSYKTSNPRSNPQKKVIKRRWEHW